jgi:DNA-binding transcriptional MerR regulator
MSLLIHEVASEVKIHIDTIKRAEKRGFISPQRDVNGWRRFSPDLVAKLKKLYVQDEQQTEAS